jgi:hypothetical protein
MFYVDGKDEAEKEVQVLTAVVMIIAIFWDIAPCGLYVI